MTPFCYRLHIIRGPSPRPFRTNKMWSGSPTANVLLTIRINHFCRVSLPRASISGNIWFFSANIYCPGQRLLCGRCRQTILIFNVPPRTATSYPFHILQMGHLIDGIVRIHYWDLAERCDEKTKIKIFTSAIQRRYALRFNCVLVIIINHG